MIITTYINIRDSKQQQTTTLHLDNKQQITNELDKTLSLQHQRHQRLLNYKRKLATNRPPNVLQILFFFHKWRSILIPQTFQRKSTRKIWSQGRKCLMRYSLIIVY